MKKSLITLLVLGLISCALFVSCNSEVTASQGDSKDLVSVSFDNEGGSKSLTATLQGFNKDNYYWKYSARKNASDASGLTSGATASYDEVGALPVSDGTPGLGSGTGSDYKPYKVPGFSQGSWDFMLFAYTGKDTSGNYTGLVYTGEAQNVSLTRGGTNLVSVVMNPLAEGNGFIKINTITFIPKKTGDEAGQTKFIEVTNPDGSAVSGISYDSSTSTYTVPAGAYKVTVKFANSAQTVVYAEGYVIATVYPGLTTEIGGNLNELVTYAQFDADLNPDAVNAQAVSEATTYDAGAQDVELTSVTTEKKVTTKVARADVNTIIAAMAEEQGVDTSSSTTLKLTLNVDPTDATETTITYEIGMKATLTYTKDTETQTSEKAVKELEKYVIVEIEMSSGLSDVTVKHSGVAMDKCDSLEALKSSTSTVPTHPGYYFYDAAGKLYIKTRTFSPFAISYTAPAAYVADVDGVKYGTLKDAVAQVKDGTSTVTLLTDIALTSTQETTKSFTLNLNGFSIATENCRAIWVKEGTLTLKGTGTIAANKVGSSDFSASSSVIRVGDGFKENEDGGTAAGLIVGENVTISSSYCYGVTLFGRETEGQTLIVNGKIKVTGTASAISGNGTGSLSATSITINDGAEVFAENDYAIYHPQKGTLTVEGGTIVGKGGIEAKGGNVIVNGGAITATAPTQSHAEYNNGASTSGYALAAVKNPNYPGDGSIRVNDGMITGELILATDEEASFTTKLEAAGGTFTEDPTSYAEKGYEVTVNPDGTYTVSKQKIARIGETYYTSLYTAASAANSGDTIVILKDFELVSADIHNSYFAYNLKSGVILDGDGHTISFSKDVNDCYLFYKGSGTIQNLNIKYNDNIDDSIMLWPDDVVFKNVNTYGKLHFTSGNSSAFVIYPHGNLTFEDCINYAELKAPADSTVYNAIFVGYAYSYGEGINTYTFKNCKNEGSLYSGRAAFFLGNTVSEYSLTVILNVIDCENNGTIWSEGDISQYPHSEAARTVNYYLAQAADRPVYLGVKFGDETFTTNTPTKWWQINEKLGGTGRLLGHIVDATLAISENTDKTFTVVPASDENVSYYVVSVGMYASTASGSTRYYVREEIVPAQAGSITTNIKDLMFVDSEWVNTHETSEGSLCGNKTYSDGQNTYYLLDRDGVFISSHNPMPSEMISVSAYDKDNAFICSVQLK